MKTGDTIGKGSCFASDSPDTSHSTPPRRKGVEGGDEAKRWLEANGARGSDQTQGKRGLARACLERWARGDWRNMWSGRRGIEAPTQWPVSRP
jgi:hypothetical protein